LEIILIASVSNNRVIGKDGRIPWYSKEEMNHFKSITYGYPVIMGRITYESLPGLLKGRTNIVLTRNKNFTPSYPGITVFFGLRDSIIYCKSILSAEKVFIIGGEMIFSEAISMSDKIYLSQMKFNSDGDTFFPVIDKTIWCIENKTEFNDFELNTLVRCSKIKKED
jgi:dihydrofolate reductase